MEPNIQNQEPTPILQVAWTRYAQLNAYAKKRTKAHLNSRRWIAALGVLATLLAILVTVFPSAEPNLLSISLKFLLVLTPILASALAAYGSKFLSSGDWLIARAGAEEILKEIYNYRTVLQNTAGRRAWLENRLAEIQRSVFRGMNGELAIPPYEGILPPHYSPDDPKSDSGFNDLNGDEYFNYRLMSQLNWHIGKVNKFQTDRVRLQVLIILSGVVGAILAVFLPLWTALAAAFTAVFIGWQELRNYDSVVRNYSKVVMELNILHDHWKNLTYAEKNTTEFFKVVRSTEDTLWSQNVEYIKAMQEALKESDLDEEASLINRVIKEARDSDRRLKQSMEDSVVNFTAEKLVKSEQTLSETFEESLRTLAEEASSELVQAELAAMKQAIEEFAESIAEKLGLSSMLENIAEDYKDIEVQGGLPRTAVNDLLSRYPKTSEVKG
jgi:uncharacterized membrane protein HdeD (DUF308 family)